jgi:hypothetical protein
MKIVTQIELKRRGKRFYSGCKTILPKGTEAVITYGVLRCHKCADQNNKPGGKMPCIISIMGTLKEPYICGYGV